MTSVIKSKIYLMLVLTLSLFSCVNQAIKELDNEMTPTELTEASFDNFTKRKLSVRLSDASGNPLSGILVKFYDRNKLIAGREIAKGLILNGAFQLEINLGNHINEVVMVTNFIGVKDYLIIPVEKISQIEVQGMNTPYASIDEIPGQSRLEDAENGSSQRMNSLTLSPIGTFDNNGVPDYLMEEDDVISSELLSFINASLPEGQPVPTYHPQYINSEVQTNLVITETADVWMTFVHEGAGYRNVLGFYTYPTGNPPQTTADIENLNIVFPNASFAGSGGGLQSGNKVYLGQFEGGTTIGFALLANGWNGSITNGSHQVFSDNHLNPEQTEANRFHSVLLWDEVNELFLVGFEDLNRDGSSDDDFNDAIFYLTANPIEAIATENVNPIDKPLDTDGDGVNDTYDEFPTDNRYAYSYAYPGEGTYGSFAFEDQWPNYGDYDFNDLVCDYNYRQIANAINQMVILESEFVIQAVGAGFKNGFGIQLDLSPNAIKSVSGSELGTGLFNTSANGTESNQSLAVIPVTDDAHRGFEGNGLINTNPEFAMQTPDTIIVQTEFNSPLALNGAGSAPFNPFLVINQARGREVHMPGYAPTDLVDYDYFGQGNDDSDPSIDRYYKTKTELPWGMNLPVSFDYPNEKTDLRNAYHHFHQWSVSGGYTYMDWYMNHTGYRNSNHIFKQ